MWTKGHELKYWNKNGLKKGDGIYANYFKVFGLEKYDFNNKIIADIGCGPFGGIFSYLNNDSAIIIPMDILAKEYNDFHVCDMEIQHCDLSKKISLEDNFCDYVICTNAIDHIDSVSHGFEEIYRILKNGGTAFIHVHLRTKEQLNKAHIHLLNEKKIYKYCSKFKNINISVDNDWVNENPSRQAAYIHLEK